SKDKDKDKYKYKDGEKKKKSKAGEDDAEGAIDNQDVRSKKEEKGVDQSPAKSAVTGSAPAAAVGGAADSLESVFATVETDPVPQGGDAADDPAIWINPNDPAKSTIIGTDKMGGLAVYDLSGKQIQYLPDGRMDNVDLRDGFKLGGQT